MAKEKGTCACGCGGKLLTGSYLPGHHMRPNFLDEDSGLMTTAQGEAFIGNYHRLARAYAEGQIPAVKYFHKGHEVLVFWKEDIEAFKARLEARRAKI